MTWVDNVGAVLTSGWALLPCVLLVGLVVFAVGRAVGRQEQAREHVADTVGCETGRHVDELVPKQRGGEL